MKESTVKGRFASDYPVVIEHLKRIDIGRICRALKDPRVEGRSTWGFGYVTEVVVGGMLSGIRTLRELETYSELYEERIPDTTLHDVLVKIDPTPLEKVLARQVKEAIRSHELDQAEIAYRVVSIPFI